MDNEKNLDSTKFDKNDAEYIYNVIKNEPIKDLIIDKTNKKEINRNQKIKNTRIYTPIEEINHLNEYLKLNTKTIDVSIMLLRVIYNRKILQNANIGIVSGACIYIGSVIENEDISTTDISNLPKTNYTNEELNTFKNKIIDKLEIDIQ